MTDKRTLTRADISKLIYRKLGYTHSDANGLVDQLFEEITQGLIGGGEVKIPDFGTFKAKRRGSRMGRNPRTGEEVLIESHIGVSFRASPYFRKSVDDSLKKAHGIPKD